MRDKNNKHLGLEIPPEIHYKLHYIAKYEGRNTTRPFYFQKNKKCCINLY